MRNKYLILAGIVLVVLLVCVGVFFLLRPGATPPSSPDQVTSGPVRAEAGDTVVKLTWERIEGASGYFVHRDGSDTALNPLPVTETDYEDTGLTNGRTYTYTIVPVDRDGKLVERSTEVLIAPKSK